MQLKLCSICVATFKRTELLKKLLDSLFLQEIPVGFHVEIIVVDNDSESSAEKVVNNFISQNELVLKYFVQPIKNISLTRNKAVLEARGDYLFFIDDDEIASPFWISSLISALEKHNADAVFGRVICHFGESTPEWIKKSYIFNRLSPPTGTPSLHPRTGNCLIRASVIKRISGPFDPAYGITGGEDTYLFNKLSKQGFKFINCKEAWVSEFQPPSRSRTSYLIKRAFFQGNLSTRRSIEFAENIKFFVRFNHLIKSTVYLFFSMMLTIIFLPNKHYRTHWATKIASNFGHTLAVFKIYIKAYR